MSEFDREELVAAFRGFDACVRRHDWEQAASYFTPDARGGQRTAGHP